MQTLFYYLPIFRTGHSESNFGDLTIVNYLKNYLILN